MAEDWVADVRKYAADADENVVQAIVKYLGIALRKRDSSLVSFSDPKETDRLRERFLRKKLGLTEGDDVLDQAMNWVKGLMSGDRTKNRVTVYYLLAHYFGKLDLFGGPAGTSAASLEGRSASLGAASFGGRGEGRETSVDGRVGSQTAVPVERVAAAKMSDSFASVSSDHGASGSAPVERASGSARAASGSILGSDRPAAKANLNYDDDGHSSWPAWLTWLLVALAVLALFFLLRGCMAERPTSSVTTDATGTTVATESDLNGSTPATSEGTANAIPTGAGVVSGVRDSKPMLTVYFESGQSNVSSQMATAADTLTSYLAANPDSKVAVSGYNDPSGNAALNAELSKKRAQAVASALVAAGVPQSSVELVKPADTTSATVTAEQARRVEVTIQ